MPFPVLGSNSAVAGYEIDNSLRFNDGDSAYLGRTPSSASNRRTWTWSGWVKISTGTAHDHTFFSGGIGLGASGNRTVFCILSGELEKVMVFSGNTSEFALKTSASLRDRSAWYHFVLAMDTTQSTDSNRFKMYINGSQVTDTAQLTYPSQNLQLGVNTNEQHYIGFRTASNDTPFDGYMADINFADGTQYAASDFGEYNDNGVWIPKEPDITYGTNGYRLEFKNSGALGTDTSGNGNNWTPTNLTATDQTTDTPTNNFCTLNALHKSTSNVVLSEGNLKMVSGYSAGWQHCASTIAVSNGKWYWEAKATTVSAADKTSIGVFQFDTTDVDFIGTLNTDKSSKGISGHGAGTGGYSYAQGDIIMCAMDIDNNKIYWGKNGTFFGTLDPANGTGSTTQTVDNSNFCVPAVGGYGGSTWELNFGVPQFSISSGNSDANGYGNFEYAPPANYYSLCSKNLAEFG